MLKKIIKELEEIKTSLGIYWITGNQLDDILKERVSIPKLISKITNKQIIKDNYISVKKINDKWMIANHQWLKNEYPKGTTNKL